MTASPPGPRQAGAAGSAFVRNKVIKVSNGAVAPGNILPRAGHPPIQSTMLVSEMR